MNVNSNTFFSRAEIVFYSILISGMSGINHIRNQVENAVNLPLVASDKEYQSSPQNISEIPERLLIKSWIFIIQALVPLSIWMILGFAAGFLIGMVRPR